MTNNKLDSFENLLKYCEQQNIEIFEACQNQEAQNAETTIAEIRQKTFEIIKTMEKAIERGLSSTELSLSGMSGNDCQKLKKYHQQNSLIINAFQKKVLQYALATAEENARMGKIAACPTAGACGIVPAIILAFEADNEKKINALITAGQIGKIISNKVALAGAVMGCQGECGSAAAMAASALTYLCGGNNVQVINAATLSLKNILGLVCDPVAGLVEVPCVKRNPFMAMNSITATELALSGIKSIIPPDEVLDAMYQIGSFLSPQLKESAEAGLAVTKTGLDIAKKINKK